jgi:hypothetical protein
MTQLKLLKRQNEAAKYNICSSSVPASLGLRPCGLPWRRLAEPPVLFKKWKFDPAASDMARIAVRIARITMADDVECLKLWSG